MRCKLTFGTTVLFSAWAIFTVFCPACSGQAWTPPKGEGEYAVVFQDLYTTQHTLSDGSRVDTGHVSLLGLVNSIDLGITDKLATTVAIPVGMGVYNGKFPHLLPIDNGNFHGGLQDLGVGLRYRLISRAFMLTPFVLGTNPMVQYQHFAHSAIGSDAWEVRMGFAIGHRFESHLRNAYFQTQYSYSLSEEFMNIRPHRHRFNGEFGYILTSRLAFRALALSQVMTNGLELPSDYPVRTPDNPLWRQHDRISRVDFVNIGGGISYSITRSVDVFGSLLTMPWGINGHALKTGASFGMSWAFRTPWGRPRVAYAASPSPVWQAKMNQPPQIQCAH